MEESKKKDTLVILTRCSRPTYIKKVAESVVNLWQQIESQMDENIIKIYHVIIFDKYKLTKEQMRSIVDEAKELYYWEMGISLMIEYRGKKNDTKYGTTMLVESANNLMSRFSEDFDPWVYILDDDNVIHPNFAQVLFNHMNENGCVIFGQDRHMLRLSGEDKHEDCILSFDNLFKDVDGYITENMNQMPIHNHPDSAQFLFRYSTLMDIGNYADVNYCVDFQTVMKMFLKQKEKIIFDSIIASYYNALESDLVIN